MDSNNNNNNISLEISNKKLITALNEKAEQELLDVSVLLKKILQENLIDFLPREIIGDPDNIGNIRKHGDELAKNISKRLQLFSETYGVVTELIDGGDGTYGLTIRV